MKFAATRYQFNGTVQHVRGNAPTEDACTDIRFLIHPDDPRPDGLGVAPCDCGCGDVVSVTSGMIVGVLEAR